MTWVQNIDHFHNIVRHLSRAKVQRVFELKQEIEVFSTDKNTNENLFYYTKFLVKHI